MVGDGLNDAPALALAHAHTSMALESNLNAAIFLPSQFDDVSIPPTANVPRTPHRASADLAPGGSGHTDTTNSCPARSASVGDLRDHAVRLMKRRRRYGAGAQIGCRLFGRCRGQSGHQRPSLNCGGGGLLTFVELLRFRTAGSGVFK
jgi:hypothetical protein